MDGPRCAKGLTLSIHEKLPVSSYCLVLGKKGTCKTYVALCIVSRPFLLARILLMATLGKMVVVCIYVSRIWRKKEVESSPSNDKRSGSNEPIVAATYRSFPHVLLS